MVLLKPTRAAPQQLLLGAFPAAKVACAEDAPWAGVYTGPDRRATAALLPLGAGRSYLDGAHVRYVEDSAARHSKRV